MGGKNKLLLQEVEKGCGPKFGVLIFNLALFIEKAGSIVGEKVLLCSIS
jgi:hypothetical protein